jgi:hypothetical protein
MSQRKRRRKTGAPVRDLKSELKLFPGCPPSYFFIFLRPELMPYQALGQGKKKTVKTSLIV